MTETSIKNMRMTGYTGHSNSKSILLKNRDRLLEQDEMNTANNSQLIKDKLNGSNFPKLDFELGNEFPIKILDSMI